MKQEVSTGNPRANPRVIGALVAVMLALAIAAVYWPLTGYFFAQDDFVLMDRAAWTPAAAVTKFFAGSPDHFRPLTKGAYFVAAWRLFGLNAFAYHLVSLLLHILNALLMWRLLRRLGADRASAVAAAAMFGLSVGFFHVLAWVACIQQLIGLTCTLLSLRFGIRSLDNGSSRDRYVSLVAYALAVGSVEQTVLLPFVFLLYGWLRPREQDGRPGGPGARAVITGTVEHWALLAVYGCFVLFWKGLPEKGVYQFSVGANVAVNLLEYLARSFHFVLLIPSVSTVDTVRPDWGHAAAAFLLIYHLARGRWRSVVFGFGAFLCFILPTLFLSRHQYYLHTYIPALGVLYLIALALGDGLRGLERRRPDLQYSVLGIALILLVAGSWRAVRVNEHSMLFDRDKIPYRRSFVIRRSLAAQNAYDSIQQRWQRADNRKVVMVYGRSTPDEDARWNERNVFEALGRGKALFLFYGSPDIDATFTDLEGLADTDTRRADVFIFDDYGNCRTPGEARGISPAAPEGE